MIVLVEHINRITLGTRGVCRLEQVHVIFVIREAKQMVSVALPVSVFVCVCGVPVGVLPWLGLEVFPLWLVPGGICSVGVWRSELPFPLFPGVCSGAHQWLQSGCQLSGCRFELLGCSA